VGETREEVIVQRVLGGDEPGRPGTGRGSGTRRIFCFGIGHDVNTHLLDKITGATRGASTYVLPEEDLEVKVSSFFSRIKDPVMVSPTVRVTGNVRLTRMHPHPLPDLFRGDQLVVAGRYSGAGEVSLVLEGTADGRPVVVEHSVRFPKVESGNDFVPRLWATRRVGYLLDELRLRGESAELRDEIAELARRYGIVTPSTAYLIVEDEARRGVAPELQTQRRLQEDRGTRDAFLGVHQEMTRNRSGLAAVAGARSEQELKLAEAPAAALSRSQTEATRAFAASPAPGRGATRVEGVSDGAGQAQQAGGRTFYWNNDQWLDGQLQAGHGTRTRRIQLGTTEYFALARQGPDVAAWLALGPRVQFVLNGTLYTVEP
jgi:Ca-activated chloride channel family protein